jgi:hypothetical protein
MQNPRNRAAEYVADRISYSGRRRNDSARRDFRVVSGGRRWTLFKTPDF